MQMISVVIKLQVFGRGIIQRKTNVCKLKAICFTQSNVRGVFVRTIIGLWLEDSLRGSIIIQYTFRIHKICSQYKKSIRSIIYILLISSELL